MSSNQILDLVFRPWSMHVLFAASRLRIFTMLANESMAADDLAERIGADNRLLRALLDACVAMELLRREGDGYRNSHLSDAHLVEGRPLYLGDLIEVQALEGAGWQELSDAVSKAADVEKETAQHEIEPRRFTLAMNNLAMQGEANALASAVNLSRCKTLVDVGCGSGLYSVALCLRNPGLTATLLDRPVVLETTEEIVERHGLRDRMATRPADITKDEYGREQSVVLLSDVLYQDKATCVTILRSAHAALTEGGKLIIRGYYSDPGGSESLFGALFVVHLLLSDPSREPISLGTLRNWLDEVGFTRMEDFALSERSTCLTAEK